jgi:hypothetical protein
VGIVNGEISIDRTRAVARFIISENLLADLSRSLLCQCAVPGNVNKLCLENLPLLSFGVWIWCDAYASVDT